MDARLRRLESDRGGHDAGAGAQVDHNGVEVPVGQESAYLHKRRLHDYLSLRARDEHSRSDSECQAPEVRLTRQMLQGHPLRAPPDECVEGLRLLWGAAVPTGKICGTDPEGVRSQLTCIVRGRRDTGCREDPGGIAQQLPQRRSAHWSRALRSASTSACTTPSRSPSRTLSRLYAL